MLLRKLAAVAVSVACALSAVPAEAQRVVLPAVAPVWAPVSGIGAAGAAPSLASSLPGRLGAVPTLGSTFPSLPLAHTAAAVAAVAATVTSVPQAAFPAQTRAVAAPDRTKDPGVQDGLRVLNASLGEAGKGGRADVPALLSKAFDSAATRTGDGVPASGGGAQVAGRGGLQRSLAALGRLKLGTYNVLNLFQNVGKHVPDPDRPGELKKVSDSRPKEDWQLRDQAKAILESELDVVVLQEVENIAALDDFNERYLGGAYKTLLIEGNDARGIDVAFLVKKDLPLIVEQRTHKEELWTDPLTGNTEKLFSRDLPSLIFRAEGIAEPLFILLGTHFKSKRDRPGDHQSEIVRRAQVQRTAEIVGRYQEEFGPDARIMLAGDFNGDLNTEEIFAPFWEAGMVNSLDLGERPVPVEDRVTHTYHPMNGPRHAAQMDGVLVSKSLRALVQSAAIYRYLDADGRPKPIPATYQDRSRNPSDHFPLIMTLDFQALWRGLAGRTRNGVLPEPESASAYAPGEWRLGALALAWSFLAIASMYVVMPVKSAFLLTQFGPTIMPWIFIASALFTGLAAWVYAQAARLPRSRLIAGTLAVLAAGLLGWWALAPLAIKYGAVSFAFSMWTDAFAIISVTLFWSYANDRFKGDAAKRWFGYFAAAGALGGMTGSALVKLLIGSLGSVPLLLIGAGLFAAIGGVFALMERIPRAEGTAAASTPEKKDLASPLAVARAVLASPFLLALTAVVFLERLVPDFSGYLFSAMARDAFATRESLTAFMASFGFWENLAALATGFLLTRWVLKTLGVGKTLLIGPLANLAGFLGFGVSPSLGVTTAANFADGWQRHGWFKAAKETTYTVVDKDTLYQVKAYIEMFVYRFARGVAGLLLLLMTNQAFLGWGPAAVAWASVPLAAAWVWAAWSLGREFKKRESAPKGV
ncbi:MAG: hypothetical protein HYZ75_03870 [Elusimicrobia bacterium]|nr:hypothetical protein [Elusimicrobiota bacterium]